MAKPEAGIRINQVCCLIRKDSFEYARIRDAERSEQVFDDMLRSIGVFTTFVVRIVRTGFYNAFERITQINRVIASGRKNLFRNQCAGSAAPYADFQDPTTPFRRLPHERPKLPATVDVDQSMPLNQAVG